MDGVTEKFSVFDFFNLIIVGIVFTVMLGTCHWFELKDLIIKVCKMSQNSGLIQMGIVVFLLCEALVVGMVFQVITEYIIKKGKNYEQKMIEDDLRNGKLFENQERDKSILKKIRRYFQLNNKEYLTAEQSSAFFAYCVYYLQVKNLDKKTEKLYETQGLSSLLMCAFFSVPVVGISFIIIKSAFLQQIEFCDLNFQMIAIGYVISLLLGGIFYFRYKIATKNRVRMVLSIYDVYVESESIAKKEHSGRRRGHKKGKMQVVISK